MRPGADSENGNSAEANLAKSLNMMAKLPTIVAAVQRLRRGDKPIPPNPEIGFAENFLYMCFGSVPEPEVARCLEVSLVLYAEHGFNAPTFTTRVTASTLSDIYSSVLLDIPKFTPIFVISRITGWTAYVMEQLAANSLIRPLSSYVGKEQRSAPPKDKRGRTEPTT